MEERASDVNTKRLLTMHGGLHPKPSVQRLDEDQWVSQSWLYSPSNFFHVTKTYETLFYFEGCTDRLSAAALCLTQFNVCLWEEEKEEEEEVEGVSLLLWVQLFKLGSHRGQEEEALR